LNKNLKNVILFIGIPIAFIISVLSVSYLSKNTVETKYYEIVEMVTENKISEFSLNLHSGQLIYTKRDDGKSYRYTVADPSIFYNDVNDFVLKNNTENIGTDKIIKYDYKSGGETAWIMNLLPTLITLGVMVLFWVFIMKRKPWASEKQRYARMTAGARPHLRMLREQMRKRKKWLK